jgi:hypothetical protein
MKHGLDRCVTDHIDKVVCRLGHGFRWVDAPAYLGTHECNVLVTVDGPSITFHQHTRLKGFLRSRLHITERYLRRLHSEQRLPDCKFFLAVGDQVFGPQVPVMSYYEGPDMRNTLALPTYLAMEQINKVPCTYCGPKDNRLFFRGTVKKSTRGSKDHMLRNKVRLAFEQLSRRYPDTYDVKCSWGSKGKNTVPMSEWGQWSYLLNLRGLGPWTDRFPFLFREGSVVIDATGPYGTRTFFESLLSPGVTHLELQPASSPDGYKLLLDGLFSVYPVDSDAFKAMAFEGFEVARKIRGDFIDRYTRYLIETYAEQYG